MKVKIILTALLLVLLLAVVACAPAQQSAAAEPEATVSPEPTVLEPTPAPEIAVETPAPDSALEAPEPTEVPDNETDLVQLLKMTRADIEAKYGVGKPVIYDSLPAYEDNGEAIDGFPVEYEKLANVWIFFDADEPSNENAKPYLPKETPKDKVIGVKLGKGSEPFNVKGYTAAIASADYEKHKKEVVLADETYKYYYLDVKLGTLRCVWLSASKDMADSWLFVCEK